MTVYEVTLLCERHYGNGHFEAEPEKFKVIAKTGDDAVTKAKKKVGHTNPVLHELRVLSEGVE
jgi:hypothetical protein